MALPVARNAFRLPLRPSFSCQSSTIIPSSPLLASSARSFSATSPDLARVKKNRPPKRPGRDRNPNRGVSILRRTGLRKRTVLGVNKFAPLPQPVLNPALHKQKVEVDKNHGLWDFFPKSKSSTTFAADEVEYGKSQCCRYHAYTDSDMTIKGRHWSAPELRAKSWEDLHKLWWVVFKERGRIKTSLTERERIQSTHGQGDLRLRMDSVSWLDLSDARQFVSMSTDSSIS